MRYPRPAPDEHHEYYGRYIDCVPDGDIIGTLERHAAETCVLLRTIPPERETHRYRPDGWTIREVLGHLIDSERVFGMRALYFARQDPAPLPPFEQDDWARTSNAGRRPLADLAAEFEAVRRGHVLLFRGLEADAETRRGMASGREFTVRSIPWILAGHECHHVRILRERYLEQAVGA